MKTIKRTHTQPQVKPQISKIINAISSKKPETNTQLYVAGFIAVAGIFYYDFGSFLNLIGINR